jgi:phage tail-like protein
MARYGTDIYGAGYYGAGTLTVVDFDATPFVTTPINYGTIQLRWVVPSGEWDTLRLVRNRYGFPLTADDGDVILENSKSTAANYYIDDGEVPNNVGLKKGIDYFYSLFVLKTSDGFWAKAGDAVGLSAKDYDFSFSLTTVLPEVFQSKSYKTLSSEANNDDLTSFLSIFQTYFDFMKNYAELLLNTYDPTTIHYPALPYMMRQLGSKFEPELGVQQSRVFLRNVSLLTKSKGSLQGVKDFIKAFTGWEPIVTPTKNQMLTFNDSSFEESVGNWANISNANLSVISNGSLSPYNEPLLPLSFPNKQAGSLKLKAVAAADVEIACGFSNPILKGIPIQPGFTYTFSVYTYAAATARKVVVDVRWYDRNGIELSRVGEANKTNTTVAWATRVSVTGPAPEESYFAVPYIRVQSCAIDELHYFDCAQFEISSEGATSFEDARGVNISLLANRINLIENPSFETAITPWAPTNATLSIVSDQYEGTTTTGHSLKIDPIANGVVKIKHDSFVKVLPETWYTMSGYVRTAYTGLYAGDRLGGFTFDWYDQSKTYISTTGITNQVLTEYYPTVSFYRTNNILTLNSGVFTSLAVGQQVRLLNFAGNYETEDGGVTVTGIDGTYTILSVTGTSIQVASSGVNIPLIIKPAEDSDIEWLIQDLKLDFTSKYASSLSPSNAFYVKPSFNWSNATTGQSLWLDATMLESSTSLGTYFDGSIGFSEATDLLWEGTPNESRSYYYKNRNAVLKRLTAQLPGYIYLKQWFALYFANSYQG